VLPAGLFRDELSIHCNRLAVSWHGFRAGVQLVLEAFDRREARSFLQSIIYYSEGGCRRGFVYIC
jgi:hypothetical protein